MKLSLLAFAALALLIPAKSRAQQLNLFNGRDLTGWKGSPEFWSVKDGAITGILTEQNLPARNQNLVWEGGDLADFELTCKYKIVPQNPENTGAGGVIFRATYPDAGGTIFGYRAGMDTGVSRPGAPRENGSLRDTAGNFPARGSDEAASSFRPGDWNEYRLVVEGNHIWIFVNGILSVDKVEKPPRYYSGVLGLQLHKFSGPHTIQFKDLNLRVINGQLFPPAVTKSEPAPAAAEPVVSKLAELKEQGPNAADWVLSPLAEQVPLEIRQNITALREDLLDEAARAPKSNAAAYKYGEQLCNAFINILDERDITLARAGYRAVQAKARTVVTSQALEARRNHQMSWPQYKREQAQRAELKREAINDAAVIAEKPKLDWAERAALLRGTLEGVYAQFRAALREPAAQR